MASKREALIASAEKSLQKGRPDAALKDYLKVLEEVPGDINILSKIGDLYVRLNRNDEALPFFIKIAEHYAKDGFYARATAQYKKANRLDPARLDIYERLAELYTKQGLVMEAKSQYQVLADWYLKQENLNGAVSIYQKMIGADPQNIQLHVRLADMLITAKRVPEALKEYAIVAGMLRDRGGAEEAIQVYEKALKIAPDNVEILRSFVPVLLEAGKIDAARASLRKALETTPRSVPLFLLSAEAALAANDLADAKTFSAKAQAVEPDSEDVLATVVRLHTKSRRPDLAFTAAAPLADLFIRRGEAKKALALMTPIAKGAADNEDVLRKIVEIAGKAGDERSTVPYRSALAEIWRRAGKFVEAADALRFCARMAPDVAEFRARLSQLEPLLPPPAAPDAGRGMPSGADVDPISIGPVSFPGRPVTPAVPPGATPLAVTPLPSPPPMTPPPPSRSPIPVAASDDSFEFDLSDDDFAPQASGAQLVPEPEVRRDGPPVFSAPAAPPAAPTGPPASHRPPALAALDETDPGRRKVAPPPALYQQTASAQASSGAEGIDGLEFEGGTFSAADAIASFEAREAAARDVEAASSATPPRGHDVEEIEELAELPPSAEVKTGEFAAFVSDSAIPAREEMPLPTDISYAGMPLDMLAQSALDGVGAPAAPRAPARDSQIEEGLVEAEVFRKYGLLEKAVEQLKGLLKKLPDAIRVREKLFELYLEQGKKSAARKEADVLIERYRETGREDRIRALEALLGPPVEIAAAPPAPVVAPPPAPAPILEMPAPAPVVLPPAAVAPAPPKARRTEIEIPIPSDISREKKPPRSKPSTAAEIELPADLLGPKPSSPKSVVSSAKSLSLEDLGLERRAPAHKPPRPPVSPASPAPAPREPEVAPPVVEATPEPVETKAAEVAAPHVAIPEPARAPEPETAPELAAEPPGPPAGPSEDELAEIDFCLDQGMVVDAAERLQGIEARFPDSPEVRARRQRLEGVRTPSEDGRPALHDILSEDLESVIDAELGKALTDEMARGGTPSAPAPAQASGATAIDESGLFSDEAEFFNFAEELQAEMKQEIPVATGGPGQEVSLEEIFREFKKGVEQQLSAEDYETHYNLGIAYKEMGLTDEAVGEFQLASKDPLHAVECCSMLGLCFLEKGLPQLAIKWYRKGLETPGIKDDDRLGLLYDLGGVYADVGDRDNGYKTFLEIYGTNASFRDVGERLKALTPA